MNQYDTGPGGGGKFLRLHSSQIHSVTTVAPNRCYMINETQGNSPNARKSSNKQANASNKQAM